MTKVFIEETAEQLEIYIYISFSCRTKYYICIIYSDAYLLNLKLLENHGTLRRS